MLNYYPNFDPIKINMIEETFIIIQQVENPDFDNEWDIALKIMRKSDYGLDLDSLTISPYINHVFRMIKEVGLSRKK